MTLSNQEIARPLTTQRSIYKVPLGHLVSKQASQETLWLLKPGQEAARNHEQDTWQEAASNNEFIDIFALLKI